MKNLPNYLTIGNLISGCMAIVMILTTNPYLAEDTFWVIFTQSQMQYGALFILLAAVFDFADGMVARALKLHSPIGKDLDSLADVVSFGIAPSMIIYKGIWQSIMSKQDALDVYILWVVFAFVFAAGAAWRLATFNISESNKHFKGLPVPPAGILIASFVLMYSGGNPPVFVDHMLKSIWFWYSITLILVFLMNSKINFLSFKLEGITFGKNKFVYISAIVFTILLILLNWLALPMIIVLYILYCIVYDFFFTN